MSNINYTTDNFDCQVKKILSKTQYKKSLNHAVTDWLYSVKENKKALEVKNCANHIGITNIDNVAHIVKADFCRNRICNVCSWRRQSKFIAQMFPVLEILGEKYDFLFATLTIKNVVYEELNTAINTILMAYDKLLKRRKIKRSWLGKIRGLEVTYNQTTDTFHPHIHIFIAVEKDYFTDPTKYISQNELSEYWKECISADYSPICHIEKVTDPRSGAVETLKYSFKTSVNKNALKGYFYTLKNRRLVSFSGVFADTRKFLKQSDFDTVLTDDFNKNNAKKILYSLYKFDATGGVYKYYNSVELITKE